MRCTNCNTEFKEDTQIICENCGFDFSQVITCPYIINNLCLLKNKLCNFSDGIYEDCEIYLNNLQSLN